MTDRVQTAFAQQAKACAALGSPFMVRLMTLLGESWPHWPAPALVARIRDWPGAIGPEAASLPLRLASGLHALVLSGDAALSALWPPAHPPDLSPAVMDALTRHETLLLTTLDRAPQTNELRRSAPLIAVAHLLSAHFGLPLRLSELGASAGLNLWFDRYGLQAGGQQFGTADPVLRLQPDWRGPLPPSQPFTVIDRAGVDLAPLRVGVAADELRLLSCLWPDQPERLARSRAALTLPPAPLAAGDAADWLAARLAQPWPGQVHLVYHTIAWQYFPAETQARAAALLAEAGERSAAPLAHFGMEADDSGQPGAALSLHLWPGDQRLKLGRAGFHGEWVDWAPQPFTSRAISASAAVSHRRTVRS